jgi:antitoxin component of RelBE/YafQ-DinJ toxin-antitoxin module
VEFVEIEIEINSLKIVLTRAANDDRIPNKLCGSRHKTAKVIRDEPPRQLHVEER